MDALRCPPPDEPVTHLSGGERRRVALCKLAAVQARPTAARRPTNHLDAESVLWLEQHLAEYKGAILGVTHDRYFLDNVAEWILELDRGPPTVRGNYSDLPEKKAERVAVQGRKDQAAETPAGGTRVGALRRQGRQAKSKADWGATRRWPPKPRRRRKLDFERSRSRRPTTG